MKKKNLFCAFLAMAVSVSAAASESVGNVNLSSSPSEPSAHQLSGNLLAYPYVENEPPAQTPAPEGYQPFHLEHYGRHGSRWLIGGNDYLTPVLRLESAERNGKLTPLGKQVLEALRQIEKDSHGRLGELSDKGALQHQAIGRRMAQNYPEIFNGEADIDAKATVVIRCILSMANALEGIKDVAPDVKPLKDASYADMWFMNYDDKPAWPLKDAAEETVVKAFKEKHSGGDKWLGRLVNDPQFAADSVAPGIMPYLYWVLANTQSHTGQPWLLEDVFTKEELKEIWKGGNAFWFIHGGDTELTKHRLPYVQRNLLRRIINRTDSAIAVDRPGANLRYGHDGILLNALVLMELGHYGQEINDLEALDSLNWHDYDIIPMAGNFQLVFYRPDSRKRAKEEDILVKAMINEREVALPGTPVSGPYYRWSDVRKYWLGKLDSFKEIENEDR